MHPTTPGSAVRAIVVRTLSGPDGLELRKVPTPVASDSEVLIDVEYAGVGFPDLLQSRGEYQHRPDVPYRAGWEVAGIVRSDAGGFRAGDRVAALPMRGGLAEVVAVSLDRVFALPDSCGFDTGAALLLNYLTAHLALVRRARLKRGDVLLVHGAAGGVGTASCQLGVALGARVIGVVSTPEKGRTASSAGAHDVVLADTFREDVRRLTQGRGVDVIVDPVGGDRMTDSLRCLAQEGRLLVLGFTGGAIPTVKVNRLLMNNISVVGVAVTEFWANHPHYVHEQWQDLLPLLRSGLIDPVIGPVFPLHEAQAAFRELDGRQATGKVLIRIR